MLNTDDFDIPNVKRSMSLILKTEPCVIGVLYKSNEGSLGFNQVGKDIFDIIDNLVWSDSLGGRPEHPVKIRKASRIKVNLFIIS